MRYRVVDQVFSGLIAGAVGFDILGLRRPRLLGCDNEWLSILGDAVHSVEQFSHGGDKGELGRLSRLAQSFVEAFEPRIDPYCSQYGHPQGASQIGVA